MKLAHDFAALLDEPPEIADDEALWSDRAFFFDHLGLVDARPVSPPLSAEMLASEYLSFVLGPEEMPPPVPDPEEPIAAPLPVDRYAVEAELNLAGRDLAALAQLRREFALRNHPDRVAPQRQSEALTRMQIANALIDEAEGKILSASASTR